MYISRWHHLQLEKSEQQVFSSFMTDRSCWGHVCTCSEVEGSPSRLLDCLSSTYDAATSTPGLTEALLLGDVVLVGLASVSAGLSFSALVMRTVPGNFRPFRKLHMHPVVSEGSNI